MLAGKARRRSSERKSDFKISGDDSKFLGIFLKSEMKLWEKFVEISKRVVHFAQVKSLTKRKTRKKGEIKLKFLVQYNIVVLALCLQLWCMIKRCFIETQTSVSQEINIFPSSLLAKFSLARNGETCVTGKVFDVQIKANKMEIHKSHRRKKLDSEKCSNEHQKWCFLPSGKS